MPTDIRDEHYDHLTRAERVEINELLDDVESWRKRVRDAQKRIRHLKDIARKRYSASQGG